MTGRVTGAGAVVAGAVAAVAVGETLAATALGLVGVALLVVAMLEGSHRLVAAGAACLYAEVLVAGYDGLGTVPILVAGAGTLVAYALAGETVEVRADLDRPSPGVEGIRVGATVGLAALAGGVALAALAAVPAGPSTLLGVLLVVAGAAALAAVGVRRPDQ